jgi:hypothetical protein
MNQHSIGTGGQVEIRNKYEIRMTQWSKRERSNVADAIDIEFGDFGFWSF